MDDTTFWAVVEAGGLVDLDDPDPKLDAVRRELTRLDPDQLRAFAEVMVEKVDAAYRWDLWGAAYLINGGCSDDGFHYFQK